MTKSEFSQSEVASTTILTLLLVTAALLRVACLGKYLFMDESPIFGNIINFFENRTLMPTHFSYPTLFSYLSAIPTRIGATVLHKLGVFSSPADMSALFALDSILPIIPARLASVFFGTATIYLLFETGRRFFDKRVGLIAAAFLCFSRLHIDFSSYALPDVTMTFLSTLSLFFVLSALKTKSVRDYVLAGAAAGFTVSTKYNGAFILLPLLFAHLISIHDEGRVLSPRHWVNLPITLSALAFAASFFVGSPGWLLSPASFWNALVYERAHMAGGHLGSFGLPYVHHLVLFWRWEKTIAILFGLGLLYAISRRTKQNTILIAFILPAFIFIGSWQKKDLHYLLFLYPPLALLSARLFSEILFKLSKRTVSSVSYVIVLAAFAWPAYASTMYVYKQTLVDSRWIASSWIQNNIQEGSRIIADWAYLPKLLTETEKNNMLNGRNREFYLTRLGSTAAHETVPLRHSLSWLAEVEADYLITSSPCYDRFFKTRAPSQESDLFHEYKKRKRTYSMLLNSPQAIGWRLLIDFNTGKGPVILLYTRR